MQLWFLIIAIVINLSLSLVILSRLRNASATAYFGISSLFVAVWATGTLMMLYGETTGSTYLGLLLFLLAPTATTLYMVLFAKHFAGVNRPSRYGVTLLFTSAMVVAAAIVFVGLLTTTDLITIHPESINEVNLGHPWYMAYGTYFSLMFCVAYGYLLAGLFRNRGKERARIRLVLVGIFFTSFLALGTNIILPAVGNSDWLWLGPTWTIIYVVTTSYAMIRHGLFDLRTALVLTFTYALSLAALAAIYYALALAVSAVLVSDVQTSGWSVVDVSLALLLAFLFQPIRRFFDKLTSRIFYQDNYNVDEFFAELNRLLTSTTDLRSLLHQASDKIAQTLKASQASFVVYTHEHRLVQVGTNRFAKMPYADARWLDDILAERQGEPAVRTFLEEGDKELRRLMTSHRLEIVLPLISQKKTIGYLFLGEHRRGRFAARDIRVIRTIADELVIAIQNALSVQAVRDLNASLEQRIDSATKELRSSNSQLQRLDEAKDEFISMASHQLRTPLTSIKGYISMLIEGDVGKVSPEQKHLLQEAFMSSERMVRLIGDFLNVSRLQTGKFVIDKKPIDLAKLVGQEIESLAPNAAARGLEFSYRAPKNVPLLNLDENKIQQVVMNFSDNAVYYSKEQSSIKVELRVVGKKVEFTVKDTGIGVPEAEQEHLFSKFFRATNARKQRPDGTGVGLFLAKKVIDAHDGEIIFESKEGKGSTFGFRLPIK